MKSSKRSTQSRMSLKAKLIGVALGGVLLWQVISLSLAASHGDDDSDLSAADYSTTSATAAAAAAAQHLQTGDPKGAKIFARQALASSPLSAAAVRGLALAEQSLGNSQQANAILSQSAALGWRDIPTQLLLAQAYIAQGNYLEAAQRIDAALRVDPNDNKLYSVVDQLDTDPKFAKMLVERLSLSPNWRGRYFDAVGGVSPDLLQARGRVLMALTRSSAPPSQREALPTISALVQAGRVLQAYDVWRALQDTSTETSEVFDFERSGFAGMAPFDWTLLSVLGVNVGTDTGSGGTYMKISTDGSASGIAARRLILLRAGSHELSYIGSKAAMDRAAFNWSIRCFGSGKMIFNAQDTSAPPPYRFDVPQGCGSQYLELRVRANPATAGRSATFERITLN